MGGFCYPLRDRHAESNGESKASAAEARITCGRAVAWTAQARASPSQEGQPCARAVPATAERTEHGFLNQGCLEQMLWTEKPAACKPSASYTMVGQTGEIQTREPHHCEARPDPLEEVERPSMNELMRK